MNTKTLKKELESLEVQNYINHICENYSLSKEKLIKMIESERKDVNTIEEALKAVSTRIEYLMV